MFEILSPVRGRKLLADYRRSAARDTVRNTKPRKGTETSRKLFTSSQEVVSVRNTKPRKGTETCRRLDGLVLLDFLSSKY